MFSMKDYNKDDSSIAVLRPSKRIEVVVMLESTASS